MAGEITKVSEIFDKESPLYLQFKQLRRILYQNPAIFRNKSSPNLREAQSTAEIIASSIGKEIFKGQDFFPNRELTFEQATWLLSQNILSRNTAPSQSKVGRLNHVVAMHPRRSEIFSKLTTKFLNSDDNIRALPHVSRLLTHSDGLVCEAFALEVMSNTEALSTIPGSRDGNSSFIFWTYGPYILNGIKQEGFKYTDLIERWAEPRIEEEGDNVNARYPGIEYMFPDKQSKFGYLTKSEKDPSHLFVNFISQLVIIPQVFERK